MTDPRIISCALCAQSINEGDIGYRIDIAPMWRRYLCGGCFDAVIVVRAKWLNDHPPKTARIMVEIKDDGTKEWRWEGDLGLPVPVSGSTWSLDHLRIGDCPFKLVESGRDLVGGITYYKRTDKEAL